MSKLMVRASVQLISRSWRGDLAAVISAARRSVLVAAPYIKYDEAVWFCGLLAPGVEVVTLANMDVDAVGSSALDLTALRHLVEAPDSAKLIALSNLHAKVFVADEEAAIITSGNLTRAGLDHNIECGVVLREPATVRAVRVNMLSLVRLGSELDGGAIADLAPVEAELRQAWAAAQRMAVPAAKRRFNDVMRRAKPVLASVQVGNRSAHAVFGEAIQFVLERGPRSTKAIEEEVRQLLPTLCDDNDYFYIRGERYGKTWKRRLRHAQLHLKRRGALAYDAHSRTWALTSG